MGVNQNKGTQANLRAGSKNAKQLDASIQTNLEFSQELGAKGYVDKGAGEVDRAAWRDKQGAANRGKSGR